MIKAAPATVRPFCAVSVMSLPQKKGPGQIAGAFINTTQTKGPDLPQTPGAGGLRNPAS